MAVPSDSLPPDRAGSPSSLIVTFAGCYLRQIGGWIAVADLIKLLALVGVPAPAVRQSVLRLKSRGFLAAERRAGCAGYALTAAGRADLEPGDRRIFRFGRADPRQGWVMAVFSVPESHRNHRHRLRSQLSWLGFGSVGSGVWVAPAALSEPARELLATLGLDDYVTWFHATALDPVDVSAWWDLGGLAELYEAFLARWASPAAGGAGAAVTEGAAVTDGAAARDAGGTENAAVTESAAVTEDAAVTDGSAARDAGAHAFAQYLRLVDDWRLFPRIDPGLPSELLPADWPGPVAWQAFSTLRDRWADAGLGYVAAVTGARVGPSTATLAASAG